MRVRVLVRLKPGVLDVQGKAVEQGLGKLGFEGASGVRIGRLIELDLPVQTIGEAHKQINEMCGKLLVNPIIETFEVQAAQ